MAEGGRRMGDNSKLEVSRLYRRHIRPTQFGSLCRFPTSAIRHLPSVIGLALALVLTPEPVYGQYLTRPQIPWHHHDGAVRYPLPAEMADGPAS
jgi:hypothetical protein